VIAVSKLCCPVCGELLDILRGGSEYFKIRGCHSTIYVVELSPWLPSDVMQEMVNRFKRHLYDATITMLEKAKTMRHSYSHSFESDSGLSSYSDQSGSHVMENC